MVSGAHLFGFAQLEAGEEGSRLPSSPFLLLVGKGAREKEKEEKSALLSRRLLMRRLTCKGAQRLARATSGQWKRQRA